NNLLIESAGLLKDKLCYDAQNTDLNKEFSQTLALYEVTKDICKSLEEEKVFNIFRENLKKYIGVRDCRYIKDNADLIKYKDYTIIPLDNAESQIVYLAFDGILEEDRDKLLILAQQFLIGLRRAIFYQKVSELAITDTLTQVYSRRYFLERFNEELRRSKKNKLRLSFLMIDIDNFKQYNDRYGHLVGDAILREISKTIRQTVRQIDFIGRYGGEELCIVLAETDKEQANFAAERIRQGIASAVIKVYDEELKATVSIGVSTFPDNAGNIKDLIEMADQALYLAKETGKNKVCFYHKSNQVRLC
ncbi:MAG: GGDEF domain-containing protein, partial [Candidatus Omnitrophota bacterium]|nr:GGDEF domain-containing protein [Candidatus Omnitrophota bacterium]